MKLYSVCFSPTGGTKKVADLLAAGLTEKQVLHVDLMDRKITRGFALFMSADVVLIAVPCYGGRVPEIAVKRIASLNGNSAKAIIVCVYGNRAYEDALAELRDTAIAAGFRVMAAVAAVAEHSIARKYAAGRPDKQDKVQLEGFAKQILQKLSSGNLSEPLVPGRYPFKKAGKVGIVPKPTRDCINCGVCAQQCPTGAIDKYHSDFVDASLCISCMRCVSVCPHSARKIGKFMQLAVNLLLKKACSRRKDNELFI